MPNDRLLLGAGAALCALVLALPAMAQVAGDSGRGRAVYDRCVACHSPARDRTGPRHCGLLGRTAGSVEGFTYSRAMQGSDIVWTEETLAAFLQAPRTFLPGTSMGYAGIANDQDRADIVAYLATLDATSQECR